MTRSRYAYQSAQDSILRAYYKRYVWNPALQLIPASISPNTLTLISTLACGTSFALAATHSRSLPAMLTAAFLVFTYLSLDNMDGEQARRFGRSSRLGEFLDHWLDTLNNGFVVLGACLAAGLPPFFSLVVLAVTTLAFFAVQWELRRTGVFRMGRVADIEGNTAVSLLYLFIAFAGPGFFAQQPIEGLPPLSVWLGIGVAGQALWTFVDAFRRVDTGRREIVPITLCFALLLLWAKAGGGATGAHLTIAFFANPVFTSRPVLVRLLDRSTAKADWMAIIVLGGAVAASVLGITPTSGGTFAWAVALVYAGIAAWHAQGAISTLRSEPSADSQEPSDREHDPAEMAS